MEFAEQFGLGQPQTFQQLSEKYSSIGQGVGSRKLYPHFRVTLEESRLESLKKLKS